MWLDLETDCPPSELLVIRRHGGLGVAELDEHSSLLLRHLGQDLPEPLDALVVWREVASVEGVARQQLVVDVFLSEYPFLKLLIADHIEKRLRDDLANTSLDGITLLLALLHAPVESLAGVLEPVPEGEWLLAAVSLEFDRRSVRERSREEHVAESGLELLYAVHSKHRAELGTDPCIKLFDVVKVGPLSDELLPDQSWQVDVQVGIGANADAHKYAQKMIMVELLGVDGDGVQGEVVLASRCLVSHVATRDQQAQSFSSGAAFLAGFVLLFVFVFLCLVGVDLQLLGNIGEELAIGTTLTLDVLALEVDLE